MWWYKGKPIKNIKDVPKGSFGYIYRICTDKEKCYVGKKQLFFSRKKKIAKKNRKGRKRFEQIVTESDWLNYNSSCKPLLEDIKNGTKIKKEILMFVKTKRQLTYYEVKFQFLENVLEVDSYNENIAGRYFRKNLE